MGEWSYGGYRYTHIPVSQLSKDDDSLDDSSAFLSTLDTVLLDFSVS